MRTHAGSCLNYMRLITRDILIIYCSHLAINYEHNAPYCFFTLLYAVAQLVEALHYKPEGREFDS